MSNDRGSWRAIQQDSPVDAYMQSAGGYNNDPFYSMGNESVDGLFDVANFGVTSPAKVETRAPVRKTNSGKILSSAAKQKIVDQVANPPPANTWSSSNPKIDNYINSILAEGNGTGDLGTSVNQAEIISFLDSQFRVALDPLLINSVTAASPLAVTDPAVPKPAKKKRKQSALQDLEPEIERELAKFPLEEREKQRKILKNRLAARTFRRRQKEHIAEMTSQIDTLSTENVKLKSALKLMAMENKMIKEQLGYIKGFLAPFGGVPGVMESARTTPNFNLASPPVPHHIQQQQLHIPQQQHIQPVPQQHVQQTPQHIPSHHQMHPQAQYAPTQPQYAQHQAPFASYMQGYGTASYNYAADYSEAPNGPMLESYINIDF